MGSAFLRERDARGLSVLAAVTFLTRALFIYQSGTPEPDATAMVAGMALAMSGDVPLGDALIYGRHVNPGMHALAAQVFPLLHVAPAHLLLVLNWMTVACATLMVFPLYALLRPFVSHAAAVASIAVWVLTPLVWESGTYYHPLVPAALLLLVALVCARRIAATPRGWVWGLLTVLLAGTAFVLRVEVVVVWPALLVWTLTSSRRTRDTVILLTITAVAAGAYLLALRALTGATSHSALGAIGFLKVITSSYAHGVNLHGLPRSFAWMALGLGMATLVAVAAGMARPRSGRGRIVLVALGWALPSIVFWLPQPTPILRHYLMASIGLAALLAVCVFARMNGRRLVFATIAIVALNLVVPEIAYRAYNARSSAPKTPHGAFFYYHQQAVARIDRDNAIAQRILNCGSGGATPARACALVQWEQLTHVAYAVAVSEAHVQPLPTTSIYPGVREVRFEVGEGEVRLLHYVYFEDTALREQVAEIMRAAHAQGYCLFAPRPVCAHTPQFAELNPVVDCY